MKMVNCKLMTTANEDILLTTKDGILLTGCTHEDNQLQTDDNSKPDATTGGMSDQDMYAFIHMSN